MIKQILWLGFNCYYLFLSCQLKFLAGLDLFMWSVITGYHLAQFCDITNQMFRGKIPTKDFTVATALDAAVVFCMGLALTRFKTDLIFYFVFDLLAFSCVFALTSILYGIRKHKCKFT